MFQKVSIALATLLFLIPLTAYSFSSAAAEAAEKGKEDVCPVVVRRESAIEFLAEDPLIPFEVHALARAYAIADFISAEYGGLFVVNYAEVPDHRGTFGIHYSMSVVKRFDLLGRSDKRCAPQAIGHIFRLTTLYVLQSLEAKKITHMGVQLVDPHIWFQNGGHRRGMAALFIADKERLFALLQKSIPAEEWVKSIPGYDEVLYRLDRFQ